MNGQTRCPKVKNVTDFGTEGVVCANRRNILALIFLITLCIKVNLMIYKMLFMIDFACKVLNCLQTIHCP